MNQITTLTTPCKNEIQEENNSRIFSIRWTIHNVHTQQQQHEASPLIFSRFRI